MIIVPLKNLSLAPLSAADVLTREKFGSNRAMRQFKKEVQRNPLKTSKEVFERGRNDVIVMLHYTMDKQ